MDKISDIVFAVGKMVRFDFNDSEIIVDPYITIANVENIVSTYCDCYFGETTNISNYSKAEYSKIISILEYQTNIDVVAVDLDSLLRSGLFDEIVNRIKNYYNLNDAIERAVRMETEKRSIGIKFDELSNKIIGFVNKISEVDLSNEGIVELLKKLNTEIDETNKIVNPSLVAEPKTTKRKTKKDMVI